MLDKILHTIRKYALVPPHSRVIVGISGGADSLALLHILHRIAPALSIQLYAATFDHHLRGHVSAEDANFVQHTAESWDIPVIKGEANVSELARQHKLSTEAAARQARYNFLAAAARQVGAERIAVAHHADDQAETVLLHLLRGSGITGLSGMAFKTPLQDYPDLTVIRPLLNVTRAEIETYCRDNDLHPRDDATNADTSYLRNRLRHETLPYLQRLNPHIARVLVQLADIAAVENDFMDAAVRQIIQSDAIQIMDGRVTIEREIFNNLHPALRRRLLAWSAEQVAGSKRDVEYIHIVGAAEVAQHGRLGALAELPGGLRLRVDYETLVVERADMPLSEANLLLLDEGTEIPVTIPGTIALPGGWQLIATLTPDAATQARLAIPEDSTVALRTRREGDRFAPLGLEGHTQKISRWMVNRKIPQRLRDRLPLLIVNGEVAAIYTGEGWAVSDLYAIQDAGQRIVHFRFRQIL